MAEEGRRTYLESATTRDLLNGLTAPPTCGVARSALIELWEAAAMLERVPRHPCQDSLAMARLCLNEALDYLKEALRRGECTVLPPGVVCTPGADRCPRCGWAYALDRTLGCVPGDCSCRCGQFPDCACGQKEEV